jgi:hypothetical protein
LGCDTRRDVAARKSAQPPPLTPPPFLLVGDAEARRYASIPDPHDWNSWCAFEEEHPAMDFTYDHLADYQQASLSTPSLPSRLSDFKSASIMMSH